MIKHVSNKASLTQALPTRWDEYQQDNGVCWVSSNQWPPPKRLIALQDVPNTEQVLRVLQQGIALLWEGDFHQGRQLLSATKRRLVDRASLDPSSPMPDSFHKLRLARAQRAKLLGSILVRINPGWTLPHRRAIPIEQACQATLGSLTQPTIIPLTDLLGILSAYQWQINGVDITTLAGKIHPRHGVFAPTRQEYLDLLIQAPLPKPHRSAIDLGTGTGVIAAILARRGVEQVIAIDAFASALACAQENIERLELNDSVQVLEGDLLVGAPKVDLIVCNPPWLPGVVRNPLDAAIHDPEHRMLKGFLQQASAHLNANGQAWLILSNLGELLELRSREELLEWFNQAGLKIIERHDIRPTHPKASRQTDPLAHWRAQEITSLWRLSSVEMP